MPDTTSSSIGFRNDSIDMPGKAMQDELEALINAIQASVKSAPHQTDSRSVTQVVWPFQARSDDQVYAVSCAHACMCFRVWADAPSKNRTLHCTGVQDLHSSSHMHIYIHTHISMNVTSRFWWCHPSKQHQTSDAIELWLLGEHSREGPCMIVICLASLAVVTFCKGLLAIESATADHE